MLERCYTNRNISYKDCFVCDEWKNYSIFKKWYDKNYYEVKNERMNIDKDILIKGNKIYSPNACIFAPQRINTLFVNNKSKRCNHLIGTYKKNNKYEAYFIKNNKRKFLGYYKTELKAFEIYKKEKEKYIKEVANDYKDKIPKKLYDAMYRYEIKSND